MTSTSSHGRRPVPRVASPANAVAAKPAGPVPLLPGHPAPPDLALVAAADPLEQERRRVEARIDDLRRHWTRTGADIAGRLRPGVDEAALDAAAQHLGLPLPCGARTWWRRVDGVEAYRSSRYRAQAPTVGPGGWVPLRLADALERTRSSVVGAPAPPGLLPVFARDEELIAVRLGTGPTRVEQLVLADDGESYQHGWRVGLEELLGTWAESLLAAVHWLPDAHDWVVDPFALRALRNAHLLD